jgi:type IV secretion system protein TrbF
LSKEISINPYLAARRAWDERYGDVIARARNWRIAAFVALALAFVAVAGLIIVARQAKIVPFVIAVNDLGRPIATGLATEATRLDDRVLKAALSDFVSRWRSVTIDWTMQRSQIDRVFAHIGQGTRAQVAISDWYRADPPQKRAEQGTVEVEIKAVLATGEKTWEVDWTEVKRSATGQLTVKEEYKGLFTVAINAPTDEKEARSNPLGVFITNSTWSRVF